MEQQVKRCGSCKQEKSIDCFGVDRSRRKGTNPYCFQCRRRIALTTGKEWWLKNKYGITLEEFEILLAHQGEVCAICLEKDNDKRYLKLCVDHNHKTGKIRGLLCQNCNRALGSFKESINVLEKAIAYLKKYEPNIGPQVEYSQSPATQETE